MGFLDKLRSALSASPSSGTDDSHSYWFQARCSRCGEVLTGRVDLRNELSRRDDEEGFQVRKVLIGSKRCFNPIDVTLYFDNNRQMIDRQIQGGEFVDANHDRPE